MELSVKTLTGKVFPITVDSSSNIAQVKAVIEKTNGDFKAETLKIIHLGKILKDEQTLAEVGVKEKDFLVVMASKAKKPTAAPAPAPANAAAEPAPTPLAAPAEAGPAPAAAAPAAPAPAAPIAPPSLNEADLAALRDMGFPETEARAALEAAMRVGGGQPLAVEFLMNGIPPNLPPAGSTAPAAPAAPSGAAPPPGGGALAALRNHPQFNQLRTLVQENPAALEPVLQQIGQQSPELLAAIRANTAEFLAILNEPVTPAPAGPAGGLQQLAQMFPTLPQADQERLAQQSGLPPQQFGQMLQMIGQMSPEQLAGMGIGGGPGGMPGGMPGGAPPPNVIQLTQEEAEAVQRLQQLGFSQREAAEAYLACDKNEELAANFLFDSMGGGGGFGGFEDAPAAQAPAPAPAPAAPAPAPAAPTPSAAPEPSDQSQPPGGPAPDATGDDDDDMYN